MDNLMQQALDVVRYSRSIGIAHIKTGSDNFNGKEMQIGDGEKKQFSLCDYLALSTDVRVREGAAKAAMDYGVYTAVSRTYLKLKPLSDTEDMLSELFGYPTLVTPRTTLGHLSVLPVVIGKNDLMVLDHQVHTSVKIAAQTAAYTPDNLAVIRHNDLHALEEILLTKSKNFDKIWYLADGIYSMYGDVLPALEVEALLEKYSNLHVYVDDAHGMSWIGEKGTGFALSKIKLHDRMILTTSLGKGFGSGGGAIVCPSEELKDQIEILGAPVMFSSPVAPPTLGAIQASIAIHHSEELVHRQQELLQRIHYTRKRAEELSLPIIQGFETPIIYLATGKPDMTSNIAREMLRQGFHVTGGVYPAVPYNNSGIRLVINLHQSMEDIEGLLTTLKAEFTGELERKEIELPRLLRHYKNIEFRV